MYVNYTYILPIRKISLSRLTLTWKTVFCMGGPMNGNYYFFDSFMYETKICRIFCWYFNFEPSHVQNEAATSKYRKNRKKILFQNHCNGTIQWNYAAMDHWCIIWRQTWLEKLISFPAAIASKLGNFTRKIIFRDEPPNLLISVQM